MSKEIEAAVDLILKNCEVIYAAALVGATKRDDWECDEWRVTFTKGKHSEAFEYFTGTGHREPNGSPMAQASARSLCKVSKRALAWEQHYRLYPDKPVAPTAASVLYALILDSSAVGQSFESWCDDLGMDSDSRKAEDTYRACQKNVDKLARIFDHTTRAAMREALEDY